MRHHEYEDYYDVEFDIDLFLDGDEEPSPCWVIVEVNYDGEEPRILDHGTRDDSDRPLTEAEILSNWDRIAERAFEVRGE